MKKKYIIGIIFFSILSILLLNYIILKQEKVKLQKAYWGELEKKEAEYILSFYQSNFNGVITYIKEYDELPIKYVVGVTEASKDEIVIGKVEITNFTSVNIGDSIKKLANSFKLEITQENRNKITSEIIFE